MVRNCRALNAEQKELSTVEVGKGGVELLVVNWLPKQYPACNRYTVGEVCLTAPGLSELILPSPDLSP